MKGIKEIRSRIKAVTNTSKITRAMQLVAASKMKKSQQLALCSRPYMLLLTEITENLTQLDKKKLKHPYFEEREVHSKGIIVVGSDKGLCGPLNQSVIKFVVTNVPDSGDVKFITIGNKATYLMSSLKRNIIAHFDISDRVEYHELAPIVGFVMDAYSSHEIDSLDVVFADYVNPLVQEPVMQHILPMVDFKNELARFRISMNIDAAQASDPRPTLVEPDISSVLDMLSQMFLSQNIYRVILEAKASEHSSRTIAMKTATDNAETLIKDLALEYNKLRQSAITNEIIEISAAR